MSYKKDHFVKKKLKILDGTILSQFGSKFGSKSDNSYIIKFISLKMLSRRIYRETNTYCNRNYLNTQIYVCHFCAFLKYHVRLDHEKNIYIYHVRLFFGTTYNYILIISQE